MRGGGGGRKEGSSSRRRMCDAIILPGKKGGGGLRYADDMVIGRICCHRTGYSPRTSIPP